MGDLVSRLVDLLDKIEEQGQLENLDRFIYQEEWTAFRTYADDENCFFVLLNSNATDGDREQGNAGRKRRS